MRREPHRLARAEAKKQLLQSKGEVTIKDGNFRRQMRALQKELLPTFLTAAANISEQ